MKTNTEITKVARLFGAFYGSVIGDALGVPFEFTHPHHMIPSDQIKMVMPDDFKRTWAMIPYGTWSDDTSMMLCILEHLNTKQPLHELFLEWRHKSKYSVDYTFDIGNQTSHALSLHNTGKSDLIPIILNTRGSNGNGSLMRNLAVPLILNESYKESLDETIKQSIVTHPHIISQVCCVIHTLLMNQLLTLGACSFSSVMMHVNSAFTPKQLADPEIVGLLKTFKTLKNPEDFKKYATGSGYVVDTLLGSYYCIATTDNFKDAVLKAISLGNDTDTTACVTGGMAGAIYGYQSIPQEWNQPLREKQQLFEIFKKYVLGVEE